MNKKNIGVLLIVLGSLSVLRIFGLFYGTIIDQYAAKVDANEYIPTSSLGTYGNWLFPVASLVTGGYLIGLIGKRK